MRSRPLRPLKALHAGMPVALLFFSPGDPYPKESPGLQYSIPENLNRYARTQPGSQHSGLPSEKFQPGKFRSPAAPVLLRTIWLSPTPCAWESHWRLSSLFRYCGSVRTKIPISRVPSFHVFSVLTIVPGPQGSCAGTGCSLFYPTFTWCLNCGAVGICILSSKRCRQSTQDHL